MYSCTSCSKKYKTRSGLQNHICLVCQSCNLTFSRIEHLKRHKCSANVFKCQETFKCDVCFKKYSTEKRLKDHKCTFCPICSVIFSTHKKLEQHYCKPPLKNERVKIAKKSQKSVVHQRDTSVKVVSKDQDIIPLAISQQVTYEFKPIDLTWQISKCSDLHLTVETASYPLYVLTDNDVIGQPRSLKQIIGDGNCFFRAVSFILTGSESQHLKVRESVAAHIHTLGSLINSILPRGQTYNNYISNSEMYRPGTWATEVEMFACADLLKTDLYTYTPYNGTYKWIKFDADYLRPNQAQHDKAVYLQHSNGNHFDVVLSTSTVFQVLLFDEDGTSKDKKIKRREYIKQYMQKRRMNTEFLEQENLLKRDKRKTTEMKLKEQSYNKMRRSNPEFQQFEAELNKKRRSDPGFQQFETDLNKKRRSNQDYKHYEQNLNKTRRSDPEFQQFEKDLDRKRGSHSYSATSSEHLILAFQKDVSSACNYLCTCCDQLWFKESVVTVSRLKNVKEPLYSQCIRNRPSFDGKEYLCHTCCASLNKGKLPTLSIQNKTGFPNKPEVLHLNGLEERLVAPVTTFFQMRELPSGGQLGIQGNIVNVPADNLSTVKMLPRQLPESQTIPVKLKRRLRYKSHVLFQNIRPQKCIEATKYLLTKPLFAETVPDGLDETWLTHHVKELKNTEWDVFIEKDHEDNPDDNCIKQSQEEELKNANNKKGKTVTNPEKNSKPSHDVYDDDDDDNWSEYDEKEDKDLQQDCDGVFDTMLYPENIDSQRDILSFAPSEGNIPISSLGDAVEELSYPTIFCGEKRPNNKERTVPIRYSDICKSELRQSDRRAAQSISNIFFKAKKIQMKQIQDKIWLSLRRVKTKGQKFTAKDLKNAENVDKLVRLDDGFRIFRTLRGSPPYWESAKRDLFAMVRQLGLPTWFISLSAAETRWMPLLKSLGQIIDKKIYTDEDINIMSWHNKCRLIRLDPVTTARYFDYRVQKFFHSFLNSPLMPLGRITEFFYRIEFQQRGSPHVHSVLWVENAPFLDNNENEEIEDFISQYITTERRLPTKENQPDLVKLQLHRHTHTCKKKKTKACRFNFPLPPMKRTRVLDPLPPDIEPDELQMHKKNYDTIKTELAKSSVLDCTFEEFLYSIKMTEEQYLLALRSSLKDTKIFLKRDPSNIRINGYNNTVLQAWMANMDIQFITNAYACLMYIVNYVSKGQRGMSNLLRRACEDAKKENSDIKHQVRAVGNKFLKHVEISAQEAVYIVLQMKLKNSSCGHIFINTSPAEERPFIVKPIEELEKLSDNSTDIQCSNVIKRYAQRPKKVENMCLADFAAWYEMKTEKKTKKKNSPEKEMKESDDEDNEDDLYFSPEEYEPEDNPQTLQYRNGVTMRRRKKKKVIRYVRYSKAKDPENFYREIMMLFMPWRKEEMIMHPFETYEEKYKTVKNSIDEIREQYEHHSEEIEAAEQQIENEMDDDAFDELAPMTQHQKCEDEDKHQTENLEEKGEDVFTQHDIGEDLQCAGSGVTEECLRNKLSNEEFTAMVRSLNRKQMEFFYHVLKISKSSDEQFMLFLSGGAGVGKTRLTKCIYQAMIRYYNTAEGENPEQKSILLTAPTGKAAYLIGGTTLHTAFNIPANQGFQYRPLKHEYLNSMRHQMENLKLIIIDEISMCGTKLFCFINQRMQEVMGVSKPFGGISLIAIGDLFQLKPVMDSWIFKQPTGGNLEILSQNIWREHFLLHELIDIMRQKDDIIFAEILNRIREGNHNDDDIKFLKTRVIKSDIPNYPTNATHLLYHNSRVDAYNTELFNRSQQQKVTIKCNDVVIGDISKETKQDIKDRAKEFEMGLSKTCNLAIGMRAELTVNIDLNDGLVNGASGIIENIEFIDGKPSIIWLKFDNENVGKSLREQTKKQNRKAKQWTPIKKICREFPVGKYKSVKISRKQFPLRLAAAKTIHRSQGDTLSEVVIELPSRKECHMHYVAFSRAEKAENMYILGDVFEKKITVSPEVKAEMERMRVDRNLQLSFIPLYTIDDTKFKIVFHNSQSLHAHIEDVRADFNFKEADICMFEESRLCAQDKDKDFHIPGFQIHRNDFKEERSTYGITAYTSEKINVTKKCLNKKNIEIMLIECNFLQVIAIYSRPKEKQSELMKAMKYLCTHIIDNNKTVIIGGDFNRDTQKLNPQSDQLIRFMESKRLVQHITDYTTDGRTTLDLIFTNCQQDLIQFGTLECYYSYHKPVWITVPKNL